VLFRPMTQCLCGVYQDLLTRLATLHFEGLMIAYLGGLHTTLHDFNELLPPIDVMKELENYISFFLP